MQTALFAPANGSSCCLPLLGKTQTVIFVIAFVPPRWMPPAITPAQLNFICIRLAVEASSSCSSVQPEAQLCRIGLREAPTLHNTQYPPQDQQHPPPVSPFAPAPSVTTFGVLLRTLDRDRFRREMVVVINSSVCTHLSCTLGNKS